MSIQSIFALRESRSAGACRAQAVAGLVAAALIVLQAGAAAARSVPESFADLVEELAPAVINISVSTALPAVERPDLPEGMPWEGTPFEDMFREFFERQNPGPRMRPNSAIGAGFLISADGHIVTNNHVIENAERIVVEFRDGTRMDASVTGIDPKTDIALLKVDAAGPLPFVEFGDSDEARVGDWVLAIGNPLGQSFSVSAGIISARGRALQGAYDDYIQTDAAINRGNSGGPLFNLEGEVIGVNTVIMTPTGGSIGLGFSMASNVVGPVVDQLLDYGETRRGWLGVMIQDVDAELSEALGIGEPRGALVSDVPEGPAASAGIRPGDVIVGFDGKEIANTRELVRLVGQSDVGVTVPVLVSRDGEEMTIHVSLGRREDAERDQLVPAALPQDVPEPDMSLGMKLSLIDDELREDFGFDSGVEGVVVTEVSPDSEAFSKGVREGDLIAEVGQSEIRVPKDVARAVSESLESGQKSILLLVQREGSPRYVGLSIED